MIVCIAEKPSVARDIAQILGARTKKEGYFEGNGYCVTWTFGHLCTLKEPHDYYPEWKSWRLDYLPMIPTSFGIKLISQKGISQQFNAIKKLVQQAEYVVNCGDAGQEGELIQRWVLQKANCKVPIKRLWISSLTEEAIKQGFLDLKPASNYDNLYAAGSARAIGDWLLGMNATRLFTTKFGSYGNMLSIGRVQTPTLAMIVQRQKEIDAFKSEDYWELKTLYKSVEFTANIDRLKTKERAEKGLAYLQQHLFEITLFEIKEGREKNPRLFDLTSLQVTANKRYGYSADMTLKLVQALYEKKHVTYPRVDTTYLSEDIYPKVPNILQHLPAPYQVFTAPLLSAPIPKSKNVFDNSKVTDHHAIIPTHVAPKQLGRDEENIYDLIARRFIGVFYPEAKVANTIVEAMVGTIPFKATGKQILEPGWRVLFQNEEEDNKEPIQIMPIFTKGESGPHEPFIHQGKTTPPKPYTEATVLRAMETAGKQVEDEELREMMKDNGIGRPSTRANIIETLFKRQYIERRKKNIFATPAGVALIDTIQNELLKSPELTGQWESKLRAMEKGNYPLQQFKEELTQMVINLTNEVKMMQGYTIQTKPTPATPYQKTSSNETSKQKKEVNIIGTPCPKCLQGNIIKGKQAYGCSHYTQCNFIVPFVIFEKTLTEKQIEDLIKKKKTAKIKGFKTQDGVQEGNLILNKAYQIELK